ncbi:hypothetical protein AN958_01031, partial [Leucoagaricus sp. SymC.cos]
KLLQQALFDVEKLIGSKWTEFHAGREGLQAHCACVIYAYLYMVVNNSQSGMDASARAVEAQCFLAKWGSCLIRQWVHHWLKECSLPESQYDRHIKSFSLLEDPVVSYIQSNKWAINPEKLANFSQENIIPTAAKKYLDNILNYEIPKGLIDYFESEVISWTQQKVVGKISLHTAHSGHICLVLPKFHCELNTIEYFWVCIKRYLREHCDYIFTMLKENMPDALASVSVTFIRKWQNQMFCWVDAYYSGLDAQEAQLHVRAFSSRRYKSHHRISDVVANVLD